MAEYSSKGSKKKGNRTTMKSGQAMLTRENLESFASGSSDFADKYSTHHGDEEVPTSFIGSNSKVSKSSIAASKIVQSRRQQPKRAGSESEDDVPHSLASEDTDEVRHTSRPRNGRVGPPRPKNLTGSEVVIGGAPASPAGLRHVRRYERKSRNRVPGAGKLIGRVNDEDIEDVVDDGDDTLEVMPPSDELDRIRKAAKTEFTNGPFTNRRYKAMKESKGENAPSEASIPSVLNKSEVFHETAQQAVLSLISGPKGISIRPDLSLRSSRSSIEDESVEALVVPPSSSAFQLPPRKDDASSIVSTGTSTAIVDTDHANTGRTVLEQPLLSVKAQQRIEQMSKLMKNPNKQLADLMTAIASPDDGVFSRGYMVRRKNACGALNVLTAKNVHRVQICWTVGLLPTLTSLFDDVGDRVLSQVFPDSDTRREYVDARKRAVSALCNLAIPQDNRLAVFHSPRLIPAIVKVINNDDGESRKGCCAVLAQLSKTKENRLLMVQVPGLVDSIAEVIEPKEEEPETESLPENQSLPDRPTMSGKSTISGRSTRTEGASLSEKPTQSQGSMDDDDDFHSESSSTASYDRDIAASVSSSDASAGAPNMGDSFSDDEGDEGKEEEKKGDDSVEKGAKKKEKKDKKPKAAEEEQGEIKGAVSEDPSKASDRYDNDPNVHLHGARTNVFALLSHLVKEKDNAYVLARQRYLTDTLVEISKLQQSPCHEYAVKLLTHLTRHRGNSKMIVYKLQNVVPAIVRASFSQNDETRKYACFALQNLSQDKPCRQELAATPNLLTALCVRVRQAVDKEERLAAIHALKNLTDEPANLIPMTNTPECFATLMQIAHASDDSVTEMMQYLGCDALATLSHWYRSIATSGQRIDAQNKGQKPTKDLFVPSLKIITWEQWQ